MPGQSNKFDILMVGDVNVDIVFAGLQRLPALSTEELAADLDFRGGGSVANCACAAAALGLRVGLQGIVGQDTFGDYMIEHLNRRGVDTSGVRRRADIKTGATVSLSLPRDRAFATYLGSIAALKAEHLDSSLLTRAGHLHVGSYFLLHGLRGSFEWLFGEARQAGLSTSLDLGWDPDQKWNGELKAALPLVDVVLPNEEEAANITGLSSPEQAAAALAEKCRVAVVKRGERGSIACSAGELVAQPAFDVKVADTTALGDCFNAGFLLAWLEERPLAHCLRYGNAAAAIAATRLGDTRYASRDEVEALLLES
jgi:sugar/nucleoside kinase (ribokinase family)